MYVFSNNDVINTNNLPEELQILNYNINSLTDDYMNHNLENIMGKVEFNIISNYLETGIPLNDICKKLGISISTLQRKINKYNLPKRYNKDNS